MFDPYVYLRGIVIGMIPPLVLWWAWRITQIRESEDRERHCPHCGYDLRASPDRCPECGQVTPDALRKRLMALREHWPGSPIELRVPDPGEVPEVIFASPDGTKADLLRQHLIGRGIACHLHHSWHVDDTGQRVDSDSTLVVWSKDVELAQSLIQHLLPDG
jgi:hypothetical protein